MMRIWSGMLAPRGTDQPDCIMLRVGLISDGALELVNGHNGILICFLRPMI